MLKKRRFPREKDFIPHNHFIKESFVMCLDKDNNNLGVISTQEAIKLAKDAGLDLVLVSNKGEHPVCKIVAYDKYKFLMSKRKKEAAKKQRENEVKTKEIKFRPCTDENDLKIKAQKAVQFFNEGHRVKIMIMFRGREVTHFDIAKDTLAKFIEMVPNIKFITEPSMQGKCLSVIAMLEKKL